VKHLVLWVILSIMPVRTPGAPHRSLSVAQFAESPEVRSALSWFSRNLAWINEQQIRITEIPAPPFQEAARASLIKSLLQEAGLEVQID